MVLSGLDKLFPVVRFRGGADRFFNELFEGMPEVRAIASCACATRPPMDIWEDEGNVYVEVEFPGLKMEELELTVRDDELTIKGEHEEPEREGVTVHRRERAFGTRSRVLTLPSEVDADQVRAVLKDGVLSVTLPKTQAALPKKIEVTG